LGEFVEAQKHSHPADIVTDRDLGRNFPMWMNRGLQRPRNRQSNEPLNSRKPFASQYRPCVEVLTTFVNDEAVDSYVRESATSSLSRLDLVMNYKRADS
jgi:hypothetical protein